MRRKRHPRPAQSSLETSRDKFIDWKENGNRQPGNFGINQAVTTSISRISQRFGKAFEPFVFWNVRFGVEPISELSELAGENLALSHSIEQMIQ